MGIFGNGYIFETAEDNAYNSIITRLVLIFEHIAKWVFVPTKQSSSWLKSIKDNRNELISIKEKRKADNTYFNKFSMSDNIEKINKVVLHNLKYNKNDLRKFNLQQIYNDFSSLDLVLDTEYLKNYLYKYQYDKSISVDSFIY